MEERRLLLWVLQAWYGTTVFCGTNFEPQDDGLCGTEVVEKKQLEGSIVVPGRAKELHRLAINYCKYHLDVGQIYYANTELIVIKERNDKVSH